MKFALFAMMMIGLLASTASRGVGGFDGFASVLCAAWLGGAVAIEYRKWKENK